MDNKAMQLSVNFLVIIIIMVVLLGLGISLFGEIFEGVSEYDKKVHKDEEERLKYLLDDGALVSVLDSQQTYEGKNAIRFPIGITNEKDDAHSSNFKIIPIPLSAGCIFTANSYNPGTCCIDVWQYPQGDFVIENNERIYRTILVTPVDECRDGFYTFKFGITRDGQYYGKNQTLWVTVN